MKKTIIGTLVAGLILFFWQFFSWSVSSIHSSGMQYTPNQDEIINFLDEKLEEGNYFVPTFDHKTGAEGQKAYMEKYAGKPWAIISYHKSFSTDMAMNMIRGLAIDLMAAFLLCWILMQFAELDFKKTLIASLAIGFIGYLTISYLDSIWFENGSMGYLIDSVASWGIVGIWLGWWLNRK